MKGRLNSLVVLNGQRVLEKAGEALIDFVDPLDAQVQLMKERTNLIHIERAEFLSGHPNEVACS